MKSSNKILATVLATAIAASTISVPAFAHDPQNHKGAGVLPLLAGPAGAAALAGTTTTAFSFWTTKLITHKIFLGYHKVWTYHGWKWVPKYKTVTYEKPYKKTVSGKSHSNMGKAVIGCLIGSAFGAITASVRKASAMGNPPRWRSQAEHEKIVASGYEKQFELTNDEAQTSVALCGLGSFALHWPQSAPVVKAKY